jgi:transcriptional regulator with XRE-family HTH domain
MDKLTLGTYLKSLRSAQGFSLREVEEKSGISNPFLSQLESGKVKKPSPVMLHKLAELYGAPYEALMELVGYPVPKSGDAVSNVFHRLGQVTDEEGEALLEYLSFLRSRTRRPGRHK